MKPGEMFNAFQKKRKMKGLRSADAVVKSEQNASHQFYKKGKKHKTKKKMGSMEGGVQTKGTNVLDYSKTKQTVTRVKAPAPMPSGRNPAAKVPKVNVSSFTGWKDSKGNVLKKTKSKKMCKTHKKMMCKKCK